MADAMREALYKNDALMALNAELGLTLDQLERIAAALAKQPAQGEAVACLTPELAREWLAYEGEDRGPTGFEAAIRAIAEHAPSAPSVPPEVRGALTEARDIAMRYALEARIPECRHFGAIAQDLDYVCAAMLASGGKASVQWETCESQCTCKVCGTVWTAPEAQR